MTKIDKITKATTTERDNGMLETFSAEMPPFRISENTTYPEAVYLHGPTFGVPCPETSPLRVTGGNRDDRRARALDMMTKLQQAYKAGMADALATHDPPKQRRKTK